jgi:hypothetical protein
MSLRITGPCKFSTPSTSLLTNAPTCSMAFLIKINSWTSPYYNTLAWQGGLNLFDAYLGANAGVLRVWWGPGINEYPIYLKTGPTVAILLVHDAAGNDAIYVDGRPFYSSPGAIGDWAPAASFGFGSIPYGGATIDYELDNWPIWPDYAATQADAVNLRDQLRTPIEINSEVNWWVFNGAPGTPPAVGDPALQDVGSFGLNLNFEAIDTPGNNAVYAPELVYVTPTNLDPILTKRGLAVFRTLSQSTGLAQPVTAVSQSPTFMIQVGGEGDFLPLEAEGPIWSTSGRLPMAAWKLTPIPDASDVVTWSQVPDGWIETALGAAPGWPSKYVSSNVLANYVGRLEPGFGGLAGSDTTDRTMKIGFNIATPHVNPYGVFSANNNWFKRTIKPPGVVTAKPDRTPLTVNGPINYGFCNPGGPAIDIHGCPGAVGIWTVLIDEKNPAAPMGLSMFSEFGNCEITGTEFPGTLIGGKIIDKAYRFQVTRTSEDHEWSFALALRITPPSDGVVPFTIENIRIYDPATTAKFWPSLPYIPATDPSESMVNQLVTPKGNGPSCLRYMDSTAGYGGNSSAVDAEDLGNINYWSWQNRDALSGDALAADPTGCRVITVVAVQEFKTPSRVYNPQWGIKNPTFSGYGSGPDTSGPWYLPVSDPSFLNPNYYSGTGWFVGECVTDKPHNLKLGQQLIDSPWLTQPNEGTFQVQVDNDGNTAEWTLPGRLGAVFIAFPTGPKTFAFTAWAGFAGQGGILNPPCTGPGNIYNVSGVHPVHYEFLLTIPDPSNIPHEAAAGCTGAIPGAGHWVNFPCQISDDGAREIWHRIFDTLANDDVIVYLECCNEIWNYAINAGQWYYWAMGVLRAWSYDLLRGAQVAALVRADQIRALGREINPNAQIKLIAGTHIANAGITDAIISCANQYSIQVDYIAPAYYADPISEGGITEAAASVAYDCPQSISYGAKNPWTRGELHDYLRLQILYDVWFNGPTSFWSAHHEVMKRYTVPGPSPKLIAYEGSIQTLTPSGVEIGPYPGTNYYLRGHLNRDMIYDPAMADTMMAWFISAQQAGFEQLCIFYLVGASGNTGQWDGNAMYSWAQAWWSEQPAGDGSTNTFAWPGNHGAQDLYNKSVALYAYQLWTDKT